ncbi:hypothetical protein [Streptomyces sp. NPDC004284]
MAQSAFRAKEQIAEAMAALASSRLTGMGCVTARAFAKNVYDSTVIS